MSMKSLLTKLLIMLSVCSGSVWAAEKTIDLTYTDLDVSACPIIGITPQVVSNLDIKVDITPILTNPYNRVPILLSGMKFDAIPQFTAMGLYNAYGYLTRSATVYLNFQKYKLKYLAIQSKNIDQNYTGVIMLEKNQIQCRVHIAQ